MDKKNINNSSIAVAPIIFGGNVLGWTLDEKASFELLDAFVDLGFNAVDTANNYSFWVPGHSGGESETILGKWFKARGNRDAVVLMTKVGGTSSDIPALNTTKEHIIEQVELSLTRLQTDYIDLYQNHYDDTVTPVDETLAAFDSLLQSGKVRAIGASNISAERLEASMQSSLSQGGARYATLQPLYNLYDRATFEAEYLPLVERYNLQVIPYYALASGFLTGKYLQETDFNKSPRGEGVKKAYWNTRGERIIKALTHIAEQHQTTISAVALAWLMAQPSVFAPIASATQHHHLDAFTQAAALTLSPSDLILLAESSTY